MTSEQINKIWNLAMEIKSFAIEFAISEIGTEEHDQKGVNLIKAKSKLYQYLMENLDDTKKL